MGKLLPLAAVLLVVSWTAAHAVESPIYQYTADIESMFGDSVFVEKGLVDPATGNLYLLDTLNCLVHVINPRTFTYVRTLYTSGCPRLIVHDPIRGEILVAIDGGEGTEIEIFTAANGSYAGTIYTGGGYVEDMALDAQSSLLHVINSNTLELEQYDLFTRSITSSTQYPNEADGIVLDPQAGRLYLTSSADYSIARMDLGNFNTQVFSTTNAPFRPVVQVDGVLWTVNPDDYSISSYSGQFLDENVFPMDEYVQSVAVGIDGAVYVTSPGTDEILVFDPGAQYVTDAVSGAIEPEGLVLDGRRGYLYALSGNGTEVSMFQAPGGMLTNTGTVDFNNGISSIPEQLALHIDSNQLYVTDSSVANVARLVDLSVPEFRSLSFAGPTTAVAVNQSTGKVYIGIDSNPAQVAVLHAASGGALSAIVVPSTPTVMVVDEQENDIYVGSLGDPSIAIIDGAGDFVRASIPDGNQYTDMAIDDVQRRLYLVTTGGAAGFMNLDGSGSEFALLNEDVRGIGVNPEADEQWVAQLGEHRVLQAFGGNFFNANILDAYSPWDVDVLVDDNIAFVTQEQDDSLAVYDGQFGGNPLQTVDTGAAPRGVLVDQEGGRVFVANSGDGTLSIFSIGGSGADTIGPSISSVGMNPYVVDIGGDTVTVYVEVSDGSGVESVTANGEELNFVGGTLWLGQIPTEPTEGPHPIFVEAVDTEGNSSEGSGGYYVARRLNVPAKGFFSDLLFNFQFRKVMQTWGRVTEVVDNRNFMVTDGSTQQAVRVTVEGHTVNVGDFVVVAGQLYGTTQNPNISSSLPKMTVIVP